MGLIQKPCVGIPLNQNHPLSQWLASYWAMNEGTGGKVFDLAGNSNGIINGANWGGGELKFDGSSSYIETANINHSHITVSSWFKTGSSDEQHIIGKWWDGDDRGWTVYMVNGNVRIDVAFTDVNDDNIISSPLTYNDNDWHNSVFTYDGSDYILYVDGISVASGSHSSTLRINTQNVLIGNEDYRLNHYFNGSIDSTYICNQALSADNIAWLFRERYVVFEVITLPAALYYEFPIGWTGKINSIINPSKVITIAATNIHSIMGIQ